MKMKFDKSYDFSPETVEKKRKFPILYTVLLGILIAAQIACVLVICLYHPKPQDVIDNYTVYVSPRDDGSLDIKYCFTWTPLDTSEELTWVEIGMANESFTVLDDHSDNIDRVERYADDDGYCYAEVYFDRSYHSGETLDFYFTVNQRWVLSTNGAEKFYEFIPGWFNHTPVNHYAFYFEKYGDIESSNGSDNGLQWLMWEGSLDCGDYVKMRVNYRSFDANAVRYERFNDDGCYDGLASTKSAITVLMAFLILLALVIEIVIIDSYVSYSRGRGFLRGYGHPVHVYGHVNPRYKSEASKHQGGGGFRGGGCACACACACAGGGRAGCSQKDTYYNEKATAHQSNDKTEPMKRTSGN